MKGEYKKVSRFATACDLYNKYVEYTPKTRKVLKKISSKKIRKALDKLMEL